MSMIVFNRVCYTLCAVSICGGAATSMAMVWITEDHDSLWRVLLSFLILFLAGAAMLSINITIMRRGNCK